MSWKRYLLCLAFFLPVVVGLYLLAEAAVAAKTQEYRAKTPSAKPAAAVKPVKVETCYDCHDEVKALHAKGKHARLNCVTCHEGLEKHLQDPGSKPATRMELEACGGCHKDEYASFVAMNLHSKAKQEKATFRSRSPLFDKLIMPHGFSKEHDQPWGHAFMLIDHYIVDRAYGGRFQLKDWGKITDAAGAVRNGWGILMDKEPGSSEQKIFLPQTAVAANPVCLSCKSQDQILTWKYMGDPDPSAQWSRTSKVVEMARDVTHPMNCFMCHDPHSAGPRVVRDALINAVVDRGEGTYPYDKEKSRKTTMQKVTFRDFRAIGLLSRPDSILMCAQCHVEYACNPGTDPRTGQPIGMDDRRTNYFPWVNALDVQKRYEEVSFKDFRHAITGALLTKLQHPDSETFWGSAHERAGVECKDCHMPKAKNRAGKTYTSHGQRSPRTMKQETCIRCHPSWSQEEAEYQIDAIQSYIRGKMTKAEFWLGQFIDKFAEAKAAGVSEEALNQARQLHDTAHIHWEWWTAENSDGFHNPALARESLARSLNASQDGIRVLDKALTDLRAKK